MKVSIKIDMNYTDNVNLFRLGFYNRDVKCENKSQISMNTTVIAKLL